MPKSPNISTVQQTPTGQTILTIPKPLAEGMDFTKGDKVRWKVKGKNILEIEKMKE